RGEYWLERRDAVPELGVGCRTVRDRAAAARDGADVGVVDTNAVNEERSGLQNIVLFQQRNRRPSAFRHLDSATTPAIGKIAAAFGHNFLFRRTLGDVHRQRQVAL